MYYIYEHKIVPIKSKQYKAQLQFNHCSYFILFFTYMVLHASLNTKKPIQFMQSWFKESKIRDERRSDEMNLDMCYSKEDDIKIHSTILLHVKRTVLIA